MQRASTRAQASLAKLANAPHTTQPVGGQNTGTMSCGVKAASNTLNIGELGRYQSGQLGRATDNARIDALVVAETHNYQREWYPTRVRGPGTHKATADTDNIPGGPKTKRDCQPTPNKENNMTNQVRAARKALEDA